MKSLQTLSYKTLLTIFFFAVAGIVFILKFGFGNQAVQVSAAWWDDMWHYRKAISISNSSGSELTDFQIAVSIGTSQLIADGKMQNNCNDIRITDINGNLLPYWIEENNPGCNKLTDTKIWLKASSLPTSGSIVYLYYGNSSAGTVSNVTTTFGPLQKLSLGASYTVAPSPHASYPDNSGRQLTNGLIREDLYQTTEATVGWNYQNPVITINLNKIAVISSFKFYLGGGGAGGINIPSQITTSYSLDNSNYTSIGVGNSWTNIEQWVTINNNSLVAAKYGQSTITSNQWAMVGEIEVYGYPGSSITASTSSTIQSEELGTGPIAYWKFDEGSGNTTYDSTSNQNNGTLGSGSSAPTWVDESQCISGKCLNFDGTNDFINGGTNPSLVFGTNSFSVFTWVKFNSNAINQYFINGKSTGNSRWHLYINSSNVLSVWVKDSNSNVTNTTIGNYDTNRWYYLGFVRNKSTGKLDFYKDGVLVSSVNDNTSSITSQGVYLGAFDGSNSWFNGLIDEVKIYPYARTAAQIKQDYNSRGSLSGSSVNLGVQSNTGPSIKSSLIAHYKFDENNGNTAYDSIGTYNSSLGAGLGESKPTWTNKSQCISGNCLSFDGNDYVRLPNTRDLDPKTSNYTWSGWLKFGGYTGTNREIFMASATGGSHGLGFNLASTSNEIRFEIYGTTGDRQSKYIPVTNYLDQWHHWSFTLDSSDFNLKVYVDSKLIYTTQFSDWGSIDSYSYLYLGSHNNSLWFYNGLMDEIKIYNKALTPEEIKQDYNAGSAIQFGQTTQNIDGTTTSLDYCIPGDTTYCAAPVAEYNFEENTGTTAKDTSGNNNNGTLYNSPTWVTGPNNKSSAINFDGSDDYISVVNSTSLQQTGNYTLETWFKPKNNTAVFFIIKNGEYGFKWNGSTSALQYYDEGYKNSSKISWNLNQWYHLSMVKIGTTASLYINGILDSSASSTTTHNTGYNLELGRFGSYFSGSLDQIKIYNYARTPAQIAYDYNKGGPIGWWKMDECQGSTVNDSSGIGNTGVIVIGSSGSQNSIGTCQIGTSAAWTNGASGKINSSLNFDGDDDYINIINNPILNLANNNYSISIWFKSAMSMTDNPGMILQRYTGGAPGAGYWIAIQSNKVYFENRADGGDHLSITSNSSYNDHLWHQVIITVDTITKTGKMYIDGNYIKSDTYSGNILNNNANMTLGGQGSNYSFNGQIDDVRIYNYALTSEQVKTVYNNGSVNFN